MTALLLIAATLIATTIGVRDLLRTTLDAEVDRLTAPWPEARDELTAPPAEEPAERPVTIGPLPARAPGATLDDDLRALGPVDEAPLELVEAVAASWWMRPRHTYTPELWAATSQPTADVTRVLRGQGGAHRATVRPATSFRRWGRGLVRIA